MADVIYDNFLNELGKKTIDLVNDTIKVMLVTSAYVPNAGTHSFKSDVTNEVAATGGYTAGGAALASKTMTKDTVNHKGVWDATDALWAGSTITNARGAVIYKDTGTAGTSPLIKYVDFGSDKSTAGTDFKIEWNAAGILNLASI